MRKRIILSTVVALFIIELGVSTKENKEIDIEKDTESIRSYTAFFATNGDARDENNEIKNKIAEITGAKCEEYWLSGQTREDAINYYMVNKNYPDFISGTKDLYEAGDLVPLDDYIDKYSNLSNYLTDREWDTLRQDDGHIYWIPQFGIASGEIEETIHEGEAFWIQTKVLKWAGYPDIRTIEEYFDLLERYIKAHPKNDDGKKNIGFTILCDDWKFFCLENPPQFLDGYPNDGSCEVDPDTHKVKDYNTSDTAEKYFKLLNEEYQNGLIDPESFTNSYEEYLDKLSTGAVLGMVDQWWDFAYDITPPKGCSYVPLPITISREVKNQWHIQRTNEFDVSSGISITTSCKDVDGAAKFINDLMDDEVEKLRFWGEAGLDYCIDKKGKYFISESQSSRLSDDKLKLNHFCAYAFFPRLEGAMKDGINAYIPEYQVSEDRTSAPKDVLECFEAYGCSSYVGMLGSNERPGDWYPMYSYSDTLTYSTRAGKVWKNMIATKQLWLPQVVMSEDFDKTWNEYMKAYNACEPKYFFEEMQKEVDRRISK